MNSMTGFGRDAAQTDRYNILVEISGVNRKQTEIAVNVPRGYAEWDASVRSIVQGAVSRGRVGVSISVERLEEADGSLQLDEQKLASLAKLLNRASDLTGQPLPLQASDLLRLDIVTSAAEASLSPEEAWPMVEKALKAALGYLPQSFGLYDELTVFQFHACGGRRQPESGRSWQAGCLRAIPPPYRGTCPFRACQASGGHAQALG